MIAEKCQSDNHFISIAPMHEGIYWSSSTVKDDSANMAYGYSYNMELTSSWSRDTEGRVRPVRYF